MIPIRSPSSCSNGSRRRKTFLFLDIPDITPVAIIGRRIFTWNPFLDRNRPNRLYPTTLDPSLRPSPYNRNSRGINGVEFVEGGIGWCEDTSATRGYGSILYFQKAISSYGQRWKRGRESDSSSFPPLLLPAFAGKIFILSISRYLKYTGSRVVVEQAIATKY